MINSRIGKVFKIILPWVVTIGIFTYLFHKIPISKVINAATNVNIWIFALVIIVGFLMYFLWDVYVLTLLFKENGTKIPYRGMVTIRGASYLVSIINHFVGSGTIAILMNRWKKISISQTGSVVFFKLYLEYYMILTLCLLTAFHIPGIDLELFFINSEGGNLVRLIILSWVYFAAVLIFFHAILPRTNGFKGIKNSKILSAFREIPPQKYFLFTLVQVTGFFLFDILIVFLALMVFKLDIPFLFFIAFFPIVRLIEAVPISIMGLGTSQMAMLRIPELKSSLSWPICNGMAVYKQIMPADT